MDKELIKHMMANQLLYKHMIRADVIDIQDFDNDNYKVSVIVKIGDKIKYSNSLVDKKVLSTEESINKYTNEVAFGFNEPFTFADDKLVKQYYDKKETHSDEIKEN